MRGNGCCIANSKPRFSRTLPRGGGFRTLGRLVGQRGQLHQRVVLKGLVILRRRRAGQTPGRWIPLRPSARRPAAPSPPQPSQLTFAISSCMYVWKPLCLSLRSRTSRLGDETSGSMAQAAHCLGSAPPKAASGSKVPLSR